MHGGSTPRGPESPSWRHGRYSRALPRELLDLYRRAASDPELLDLRSEVALADARLAQLLARLGTGESPAAWARLSGLAERLRSAHATGDRSGVEAGLAALGEILDGRLGDRSAWAEVAALLDLRRRLVEGEARRVERLGAYVTAEQTATLASAILAAIREEVTDPRALGALAERLGALLAAQGAGVN